MERPEHLAPIHPDQRVVLIVDDERIIRDLVRAYLERDGYFILTAEHGEAALRVSEDYPGKIDLLLTDVVMPMMNGLELSERIVVARPEIKVLVMSGETPTVRGFPFLPKPFGPEALKENVRAVLNNPVVHRPSDDPAPKI